MSYIGAEPDGKGSAERFVFTATGSTTDTVSHADSGLAINYEANHVSVYLNGVKQVVGTDVTASNGSTLVFASNLAEDDVVEAIALSSFSPADTVPAATGGTFSGVVTASAGVVGNLTGNASGTAATVTGGTQAAITSAANLVTVGTIGTGVWQGTAIADGYLGNSLNATHIADGSVTSTEFQYINSLTSNAQTQLDAKATKGFSIAMGVALG